jgi:hypothetical protein
VYSSASGSIVEVIWVRRMGLVSTARRGRRRGHCRRSEVVGLVQQHQTYVYSSEDSVYHESEEQVSENVSETDLDFGVVRRDSITHESMRSPQPVIYIYLKLFWRIRCKRQELQEA